ncbi:MAG: hypothetical protein V7751_14820 [Pseudoalteromonas distincta]
MIRLSPKTSILDILSWEFSRLTIFEISRSSGFEVGAQGVALSSLRNVGFEDGVLRLDCQFIEPSSPDLIEESIFSTPFGYSLARLASEIYFESGPASPKFKALLASVYNSRGGELGDGKQCSLICVDPRFTLPPLLKKYIDKNSSDEFPAPSSFSAELKRMSLGMGFSNLFNSASEASLISYVYEVFRNAFEHGVNGSPIRSTRALILEKIVMQRSTLSSRQISVELRNYLSRIADSSGNEAGLGVLCITVSDQGRGIQSTLPSVSATETVRERFARAFAVGESRKPKGMVSRGLGLPNAVTAAHKLNAMIQINSGNLSCIHDFSEGNDKYPVIDFSCITENVSAVAIGTSISIFIPEYSINLDQHKLF